MISDYPIARSGTGGLAPETESHPRWREAARFVAAAVLGVALLFGYEIYFFVVHGVDFFEVLASAVQHAEGFFPAP
jgi:hypothetical protein